jgi:spore germination cell wall hydrolase CwlJ-like protein
MIGQATQARMSGGVTALVAQDTKSLFSLFSTRGKPRALLVAALAGVVLGLIVCGAYLAGAEAKTAEQQVRIGPLAEAAEAGYAAAARAPIPAAVAVADNTAPSLPAPTRPATPVAAAPFQLVGGAGASRDLDCLAAAVYYEARGESLDGQAAVAQVVLNRARQPSFPKSVCGVVFQGAATHGCQFSFACNGAMRGAREAGAWLKARAVAARALGGYVMAAVGRADSFHAARLGAGGRAVTQVGGHLFFAAGRRSPEAARQFAAETPDEDSAPATPAAPAPATEVASASTAF